jgi:hypothetical protein
MAGRAMKRMQVEARSAAETAYGANASSSDSEEEEAAAPKPFNPFDLLGGDDDEGGANDDDDEVRPHTRQRIPTLSRARTFGSLHFITFTGSTSRVGTFEI